MEARKVQRVGRSTLVVSLPNEWTKEVGLKQGDLLTFMKNPDGSLTIQPGLTESKPQTVEYLINSDLCDEPGILQRIIVGNYVLGRDTMRILSSKRITAEHVQEVREIAHRLLGIGIIEETSNQILLQCSIDASKFPVHSVIRRLYIIASTMHKEVMQALEQVDISIAKQALLREDEADMLYWLITRLVFSAQQDKKMATKIGLEEPLHILGSRAIALMLERIADWGAITAQNVIEIEKCKDELETDKGKNLIKKILELGRMGDEISYRAMRSLYSGDIKLASSVVEFYKHKAETLEEEIVSEIPQQKFSSFVSARLRTIAWGMRRIAELGAEMAQITINRSLEVNSKFCEAHIVKEQPSSGTEL